MRYIGETEALWRVDGTRIRVEELEQTVTRLMREARVTGLAVAILNNNRTAYTGAFGFRNEEKKSPLTTQTIMYGASFTKAVFAYLVMMLVDAGVLDLDKPVTQYLDKPLPEYEKYQDLKSDARYKQITAKMLLSHTAGFPNFRDFNSDKKLDIKFSPGTKYSYSGEGINLLQFVIEAKTRKMVGDMMRDRIFKPFGMVRTGMVWEPRFEADYADGHDETGQILPHRQRRSVRAAGSMDTTITDYARFMESVMQGRGLSKRAKETLLKPVISIYSKAQFPTPSVETTDENRAIQLAYALGWGVFQTPHGKAYFKEGHNDGWENHSVVFDNKKIGIVLMANSSNGDSIFKELLEILIGDRYTPWKWEGYIPFIPPPGTTPKP